MLINQFSNLFIQEISPHDIVMEDQTVAKLNQFANYYIFIALYYFTSFPSMVPHGNVCFLKCQKFMKSSLLPLDGAKRWLEEGLHCSILFCWMFIVSSYYSWHIYSFVSYTFIKRIDFACIQKQFDKTKMLTFKVK